ncbi:MAG: hypothetical protein LBD67_03005 [Candidatus Accumulibacter sp.]|nr:hypothetical protein [Accumulibacter sp.]
MNGRSAFPVRALRQRLFPFVLSLSRQERTLQISFQSVRPACPEPVEGSLSKGKDWEDILREASFVKLKTGQGERIGKVVSGNHKRLKMA